MCSSVAARVGGETGSRSCGLAGGGERDEGPDGAADFVSMDAPTHGQGLHQVEAASALVVVFGLAQMWGGGAAFVEDGEDQQSAARVEGDAESATGKSTSGVADGVGGQLGHDQLGDVGLGAVAQVAHDELACLADLGSGAGKVATPPVDLFEAVQRWGHRGFLAFVQVKALPIAIST